MIPERQDRVDRGAKAIYRLAADLREAFPDLKGFSPRNLKYMRPFAASWPERAIVQEALAQISWYHHIGHFAEWIRYSKARQTTSGARS